MASCKTNIAEAQPIVTLAGKTVTQALLGDDNSGYRTLRVEFTDGSWMECQADGHCADMSFEVHAQP